MLISKAHQGQHANMHYNHRTIIQWNCLEIPNLDTMDLETFKNVVAKYFYV